MYTPSQMFQYLPWDLVKNCLGGVYDNINIFFNMANCLGLAQPSDTSTNTTAQPTTSAIPFIGAAPTNRIQRGLWLGMLAFQICIGWVVVNL
jgi:hypothetical protein